ncbi:MAG: hypothetical protein O3A46_04670 [Candidatus Poribacteria bacterium]|nr:hypothetical protein [Candidatus Poribacteria bacterium]
MKRSVLIPILLSSVLAGCARISSGADTKLEHIDPRLIGNWKLSSVDGKPVGGESEYNPATQITTIFDPVEWELDAKGDCDMTVRIVFVPRRLSGGEKLTSFDRQHYLLVLIPLLRRGVCVVGEPEFRISAQLRKAVWAKEIKELEGGFQDRVPTDSVSPADGDVKVFFDDVDIYPFKESTIADDRIVQVTVTGIGSERVVVWERVRGGISSFCSQ